MNEDLEEYIEYIYRDLINVYKDGICLLISMPNQLNFHIQILRYY